MKINHGNGKSSIVIDDHRKMNLKTKQPDDKSTNGGAMSVQNGNTL